MNQTLTHDLIFDDSVALAAYVVDKHTLEFKASNDCDCVSGALTLGRIYVYPDEIGRITDEEN